MLFSSYVLLIRCFSKKENKISLIIAYSRPASIDLQYFKTPFTLVFLFHFCQELSSVFSLAFKCINPTRTWRTCLAGAALWASYLSLINTFSHPIYLSRVRQTVTTVPCKHVLPHSLEGLWAQTNTPLVEGGTHIARSLLAHRGLCTKSKNISTIKSNILGEHCWLHLKVH